MMAEYGNFLLDKMKLVISRLSPTVAVSIRAIIDLRDIKIVLPIIYIFRRVANKKQIPHCKFSNPIL